MIRCRETLLFSFPQAVRAIGGSAKLSAEGAVWAGNIAAMLGDDQACVMRAGSAVWGQSVHHWGRVPGLETGV